MKILNFLFFGFLFIPFLFRFDTLQDVSDDVILLDKNVVSVGQTFVAKHNNIYLIKLVMNNPQLSSSPRPLFFFLKTKPTDGETLATIPFSSANIGANYSLRLQFPPVPNSAGKSYYLELSLPKTSTGSALEIRRSKQDVYNQGSAYINEEKTNSDLAFKVYYKVSLLQFIKDSGADLLRRINQDLTFILTYLVVISVVAFLTIYSFLKR